MAVLTLSVGGKGNVAYNVAATEKSNVFQVTTPDGKHDGGYLYLNKDKVAKFTFFQKLVVKDNDVFSDQGEHLGTLVGVLPA